MTLLADILTFNKEFVAQGHYLAFQRLEKQKDINVVVVTCMDSRLVELAHKSLNLSSGQAKIIKNAGALISHPFGSVMRSLIVAVYELKTDEIIIMGHKDCGMSKVDARAITDKMLDRGVKQGHLDILSYAGVDLKQWLHGFDDVFQSVRHDVDLVRNHPLLPKDIPVHGQSSILKPERLIWSSTDT